MAGRMTEDKISLAMGYRIEEESEHYRSINETGFWQMPGLQN